jgi:hypothetical protein
MRILITLLLVTITPFLFAQNTASFTVYFPSDSYKITTKDYTDIADFIAKQGYSKMQYITIEGHTDNSANEVYNQQLSENRCKTVSKFLVGKLNVKVLVNIIAKGESQPATSNETDLGKQQNRRVVITVFSELEKENTANEETKFSPQSEDYFYDNWRSTEQSFTINPSKSNTLKGKQGTIVIIPPNAICHSEDFHTIQIHLEEYYDKGDMLMARLTTSSDENMLETAGMVNLTATHDGKELELCKKATVLFPKKMNTDDTSGFQGFTGDWDNPHGNINWNASSPIYDAINGENYKGSKTDLPNYVTIRCGFRCDYLIRSGKGGSLYRTALRKDEVKQRLRKRFWFKTFVPTSLYEETYAGIKYRMKDTMSASLYFPQWQAQLKTQKIRAYLDSLSNGGEIDPDFLEETSNYLITQVSSFGPINCDRFYNYEDKINFTFKIGDSEGTVSSRLIFHHINSIMPGEQDGKKVRFSNIPKGEVVTLLLIKYLKDNILIATDKFKLGSEPNLDFKVIEKSKLQETIRQITGGT